ncbi:MAG: amidohydrolase family protein [Blautia sp.]|nr:amidohydrolase family protein [Blautia sp.]
MDILIKNGRIVDGTGNKPFIADIAVQRDRIAGIGKFEEDIARQVIDAEGFTVTPGLIDGHTHSELNLMVNRQHPNALYQGISTVVTGQCGLGFAPMNPAVLEESVRFNAGIFGNDYRFLKPWRSFEDFLDLLSGCAVNVGANVSHNAIRQAVCGFRDEPLTGSKLLESKKVLESAMKEGAAGLSVGLSYYPGGYSDTQELIELCHVVKEYDGVFCVHLRLDDGQIPLHPVEEIARIVKETGVRLNMLHYRTGSMLQGIETLFAPFQELEAEGMEIHYEYYPYMTGAGLVMALIPGWAQEGGPDAVLERLGDRNLRKRLIDEMDARHKYFFDEGQTCRITLTEDPYSPLLYKTMDEIAAKRGIGFSEAVIETLLENHLQLGFMGVENQTEELKEKLYEDQYRLFLDERYTIGSDTIPAGTLVHPRAFGAFTRVIRMMRKRNVPDEYIIKKLTSYPAAIYHIEGRGMLKEGFQADICLMKLDELRDTASFENGRNGAEGVDTLLVNGLPVLRYGKITGVLPGQAVRRGRGPWS